MNAFRIFALALVVGAFTAAVACGPDGKCVGKQKASCCLSKASAKKSCSLKHDTKEAKLETNSSKNTDNAEATATSTDTRAEGAQPVATPKR